MTRLSYKNARSLAARRSRAPGPMASSDHSRSAAMSRVGRLRAAALALALVLPVVPAAAGMPDIEHWRVKRPGIVLVEPDKRAGMLARLGSSERRRLCPGPSDLQKLQPIRRVAGPATSGSDPAAQPFTLAVMLGGAAVLAGDVAAGSATVELIKRWAAADAQSELVDAGPERTNVNTLYSLKRVLAGTIPAWAILRTHAQVEPEKRAKIDAWLARRVKDIDQPAGAAASRALASGISNRNNHRLLLEAVITAWGALSGDDEAFRRGPRFVLATLREMRADGSLPLEVARGARALWYQRHAVASMVMIAEIAARQGYDLYALDVEGKRLDRAVRFLLDAAGEPSVVAPYTGERQDMSFLDARQNGRHYMAWLEAWMRHAPREPLPTGDIRLTMAGARPLVDELSGGNISCFFVPID